MRVAFFVTCLVDLYRPEVGFAAVKLLELAGCDIAVPRQTCCGQPAYNNGDLDNARTIGRQVIEAFESFDYIVAPSGSCTGMLKRHYPELFANDPAWSVRARSLAPRCYELTEFLTDVLGQTDFGARHAGHATYHDSCSSLRELGIHAQPRRLLANVQGLRLTELGDAEVCCGFGGTFCVKYPELSTRMVDDKVAQVHTTGADTLLAADLGCLLNIAGRLHRVGSHVHVYHVAEILAGMADGPGLGEAHSTAVDKRET